MTSGTVHSSRLDPMTDLTGIYDSVWAPKDDVPLDLVGRSVSTILIVYIILNRVVPDRLVLPVGASIRLPEVILLLLGVAWFIWLLREPKPFPTGLVGLFGLLTVAIIGLAPFIHAVTMNKYQANGAERGLFRMFVFAGLFLAAFHLAFRLKEGLRILGWIVVATAFQAVVAIYEFLTATPVMWFDTIATSVGLIPDPQSIRSENDLFLRLTGEVRAVATAPHPIVLSSVIAIGVMVAGIWLLNAKNKRTMGWLVLAGGLLVLAIPVANSRTAFVILAVAIVPLLVLHIRQIPQLIRWALPLIFVFGVAFALSPETPRLILNSFTNPGEDHNTQVRIERAARVPELMAERPIVGAGYLTHDVAIQLFDNAYFLALVELGVVGFGVFFIFLLASLARCWIWALRAFGQEVILPIAGVIAVIGLIVGGATFDAWTFDQFLPTSLILMGLALGRCAVLARREKEAGLR